MRLRNSGVVVTGASRGIGAATARALGERGAEVALVARTREDLESVAADVADAGGTAHVVATDLSSDEGIEHAAEKAGAALGAVDAVVCAAGTGDWTAVPETTPAEAGQMMAVTYGSAFGLTRAFLPGMLDRGRGRVALVTSPAAYTPVAGATAYTASRWAVRGFAEALRTDLYATDLGVTLVVPGVVETGYFEANANVHERLPEPNRLVSPARVGEAVATGLAEDDRYVVEPAETWLAVLGGRLAPGLVRRFMSARGWQPD